MSLGGASGVVFRLPGVSVAVATPTTAQVLMLSSSTSPYVALFAVTPSGVR